MAQGTCSVPQCGRVEQLRHGMCQKHYLRVKATGTTDDPAPITACVNGHEYALGNTYTDPEGKRHCKICRAVARRADAARFTPKGCKIPGCGRRDVSGRHGWCPSHYLRWKLHGDPLAGMPIRPAKLPADEKAQSLRDATRRWRERNLARDAARHRAYKQAHKDAVRETHRRWRTRNPERWRDICFAATAKRRAAIGAATEYVDRAKVIEMHGMTCHLCKGHIECRRDLHLDHVYPLSRGGSHTYDNIRPAHAWCNLRKYNKLLDEYLAEQGLLIS